VQENKYRLHLHKQSGTNDFYDVTVRADGDAILSGESWKTSANVATFRHILERNQDIILTLTPDRISPRIAKQTFKNLNTIELYANEPLDKQSCENDSKYTLSDMDKNYSTRTDVPRILSAQCHERGIILTLEGVTKQPEEFYQLIIHSLRDVSGNELQPNPRAYTVVQRL
jgi:hypothetical protein